MLASLGPCPRRSSTQDSASDSPASADMCQCAHAELGATLADGRYAAGEPRLPCLFGPATRGRRRRIGPRSSSHTHVASSNGARLRGSRAARAERATHCASPSDAGSAATSGRSRRNRRRPNARIPVLSSPASTFTTPTPSTPFTISSNGAPGHRHQSSGDNDDPSGVEAYLPAWPTSPRQGSSSPPGAIRDGRPRGGR
jgi:hypothetical protein